MLTLQEVSELQLKRPSCEGEVLGDRIVVPAPGSFFLLEIADNPLDVILVGSVAKRGDGVGDVRVNAREVFGLAHVKPPLRSFYIIPDSCTFAITQ